MFLFILYPTSLQLNNPFFRITTHLQEKEGSFVTFESIYDTYSKASAYQPESKREMSLQIHRLLPKCIRGNTREGGVKKKGFQSMCLLSSPQKPRNVPSMQVGDADLIATGDIKDGMHMFFSLKTDPLIIELCGKQIPLSNIGLPEGAPITTVKAVLVRAKLCRGVVGGRTCWTNVNTAEVHQGSSASTCQQILTNNSKACTACVKHKQYVSSKKENEVCNASTQENRPKAVLAERVLPSPNIPVEPSLQHSASEESVPEKLDKLRVLLAQLGVPQERADLLVESVRNDSVSDKQQRRWSGRYLHVLIL
jgi:hypothetical protein